MTKHSEWVMGIDLGDKMSDICRLNRETGEFVESRVAMNPDKVRKYFADVTPCKVYIECGAQSRWFSEVLTSLGFDCKVIDPRRNALLSKNLYKTDKNDAYILAQLACSAPMLIRVIKHRGAQAASDLAVIRARHDVVRAQTSLVNAVRGIAKCHGFRFSERSPSALCKAVPPENLQEALQPLLDAIASLDATIKSYNKVILKMIKKRYPEARRLMRIRGVGPLTALTFVLVIEDPERFDKSRQVGAYIGLRPKKFESGSIKKQLGISKAGDGLLRQLLVQCSHYILGKNGEDSDLRRWGESLVGRGGKAAKKRACVAVARKLAVLLHRLWIDQSEYEPLRGASPAVA